MILILIILKNMIFLEDNKMKTFVDIIESEAEELFCGKYNNQDKVPSWYMFVKVK